MQTYATRWKFWLDSDVPIGRQISQRARNNEDVAFSKENTDQVNNQLQGDERSGPEW